MEHTQTHKGKVKSFVCDICGQYKQNDSDITTGYGTNNKDQIVCYECCAKQDRTDMRENGRITLYLTIKFNGKSKISNWPGSLVFNQPHIRIGRHNWGLTRYDVWFVFNGFWWWGVRYGDNTQLCHCKQTKQVV